MKNKSDYKQLEAIYKKSLGLDYNPLDLPKKYPKNVDSKISKEFYKLTTYEDGSIYQDDNYIDKLTPTASPFKLLELAIDTSIIFYIDKKHFRDLNFLELLITIRIQKNQIKRKIDYINAKLTPTDYHLRRSNNKVILDFKTNEPVIE